MPVSDPQHDSLFQAITQRLYWLAIGPVLLALLLLGVSNAEKGKVGFSIAYLVALAGLPLSRWLDMRSGSAMTAVGKPATANDFRNYVITAVTIGVLALTVVHTWLAFAPPP